MSRWKISRGKATDFGHKEYPGEVRAYDFEAIWLSTNEYDEVDDAEEWWKCIKNDYEK